MSADVIEQAKAVAELDRDEFSVDLRSALATFEAKTEAGNDRAALAWARAVVKIAAREDVGPAAKPATVAELKAEIAERNDGRDEADQIKVPSKAKHADLVKLLADDDAAHE